MTLEQIEARFLWLVALKPRCIEGDRRRMAQIFDLEEARRALLQGAAENPPVA